MIAFLLILCSGILSEFDYQVRYAAQLRERGLYRLSELQCMELLADSELDSKSRVKVSIQLSKSLAAKALDTRPPEREQFWQQSFQVLSESLTRSNDSASKILLQTQLALTTLQRAEWIRREAEVLATSDDDWEQARAQIRESIKQLKAVERELSKPRMRSGNEGLAVARVTELQRNTRYQLSRAYLNQAITYANRQADRISSLTMAIKQLQPIASDTEADILVWESRIDRIRCYRLRGDLERANQLIAQAGEIPEVLLGRLAAEGVRLALDARRPEAALKMLNSSQIKASYPELELARIETFVTLAQQSEDAGQTQRYQQQAAQIISQLNQQHGTYWGLRGETLLARLVNKLGADTSLMDTVAKTKLKQAKPGEAIDTFDRAAEQAKHDNDAAKAFDFRYDAATVDHQQGNLQAAIDRFVSVAREYPTNPRAAEAHLLAIFDAAALYQQNARDKLKTSAEKSLRQYEFLITEHLDLWPHASTADQARIWFGRLAEAKRNWTAAIEAYRGVDMNSEHAVEAYQRLGSLHRRILASPSEDTTAEVMAARAWFAKRLSTAEATDAQAILSIELAKLSTNLLPRDYSAALSVLDRQLSQTQPETSEYQQLRSLMVVAHAGLNQARRARDDLAQVLPLPKESLLEILQGLQPIRDIRPDDIDLRSMAVDVVKLLQAHRADLQPHEELLINQAIADASDPAQALVAYEQLALEHPRNLRIQRQYAKLISQGRDRASREKALKQWRLIVKLSRPQSSAWFRAKLGVAQAQFDKGERDTAKQIIELLMTLYPDMGGTDLKASFQQLLDRCN